MHKKVVAHLKVVLAFHKALSVWCELDNDTHFQQQHLQFYSVIYIQITGLSPVLEILLATLLFLCSMVLNGDGKLKALFVAFNC